MDADTTLTVDLATLPDDAAVLKQLVLQLFEELQKAKAALQRQEHHMHLLLRRLYGSTSEKFDPQQALLFDPRPEGDEPAENPPSPPAAESTTPRAANRDRHGRGRIPEKVQREEVVHDLTDGEKEALGGADNLIELPPEKSEQLDWRPSTLHALVHVRKKYARREQLLESGLTPAEQNVVVAAKPAEAIPGGLAAPACCSTQIMVIPLTPVPTTYSALGYGGVSQKSDEICNGVRLGGGMPRVSRPVALAERVPLPTLRGR